MNYIDYLKEGSGIHIKKKNRGKFTDYCGGKVTEECIARGKNSPSATIRKRATFAANARKWKHKDGGIIKAAKGTYIDTGRTVDKIRELDKKNQKEYKNDLNKFNSNLQIQDLPEQEEQETIQSSNTSTSSNDGSWINQFLIRGTTQDLNKNYSFNGTSSEARNQLKQYLESRGNLDADTIDALLAHAGAESGYNYLAKNPNGSAYGLGQWIAANHQPILDYINSKNGTHYTSIKELPFEDQAEALAWWYYDKNKSLIDNQQGLYNKVKVLAKLGLGPGIVTNGSVTIDGDTYTDTDEDWLRYFRKYHPTISVNSFDDHVASRLKHAGYNV